MLFTITKLRKYLLNKEDFNQQSEKIDGIDGPTDEQVETSVSKYLDEHPEVTTTVQDGAITEKKLHDDLADVVFDRKKYKDPVTIESDYAVYKDCEFNAPVTINGRFVRLINVVFKDIEGDALTINESAWDCIVDAFVIRNVTGNGLVYGSYGGSFSNFAVNGCAKWGLLITNGGAQFANGKVFCNGTAGGADTGGVKIENGGWIPCITMQNVCVQQNYNRGLKVTRVINSRFDVLAQANCWNNIDEKNDDGVFQSKVYDADYGVAFYSCRNINGKVNGLSCWDAWKAADKGYFDDGNNPIDVTWESCYYDAGNIAAPRYFTKFLPRVHAAVTDGLHAKRDYTEENFRNTDDLDLNALPTASENGAFIAANANKDIPISGLLSGKGLFRVNVIAEGLNIYPYVVCVYQNADSEDTVYYRELETNVNAIRTRGQNSEFNGSLYYDSGADDNATIKAVSLYLAFNRVESDTLTLSGTLSPVVRVSYIPL